MDFEEFSKYIVVKDKSDNEHPLVFSKIQTDYIHYLQWCKKNEKYINHDSVKEWLGEQINKL